jgi:hypothetical protein
MALARTDGSAELGERKARLSAKHAQIRDVSSFAWSRKIFNKNASADGIETKWRNDCSKLAAISGWIGSLTSKSMAWLMAKKIK